MTWKIAFKVQPFEDSEEYRKNPPILWSDEEGNEIYRVGKHTLKILYNYGDYGQEIDYPIRYDNGTIAYDWPGRVPDWMKQKVKQVFDKIDMKKVEPYKPNTSKLSFKVQPFDDVSMHGGPFPSTDEGCWIDSGHGRFIGETVIRFAEKKGMQISKEDELNISADGEYYHELWDEAETYLQQFAPEGYYFGSNDNGDWGLWKIEEDD